MDTSRKTRKFPLCWSALILIFGIAGCTGMVFTPASTGGGGAVQIIPAFVEVSPGAEVSFSIAGGGLANSDVQWSVVENNGGQINNSGRYQAPESLGVYHVAAKYNTDQTRSALVLVSSLGGGWATTSAACAAEPFRSGNVYYVCDCGSGADPRCAAGNAAASDSNTADQARNPATPWRSYSKAMSQFASMNAGDTIAFCRGGVINQNTDGYWSNTRCRADNTCDVRDYDPPWDTDQTAALPIINSSGYRRIFGLWNSGNSQQAQQGYRLLNLQLRGNGSTTWGVGIGSATTDVTLCNLIIDGVGVGVQDDCHGNASQRIQVLGSRIVNTSGMGVLVGGSGNVIANNYFDHNGSQTTFDHAIYLSVIDSTATNEVVSGNEIHHNVMNGNLCQGVVIVAHGQHQNLIVENNLIEHAGIAGGSCWGIGLTPGGYGTAEWFRGAIVRGNRIYGTGSAGIAVDMCTDCLVENNLVVVDGNGSGGAEAIKAPTQVYTANGSDRSRNITIRNNTVYFTSGASSGSFRGVSSINDGSGHVASNNAVAWYGTSSDFVCLSLQASYTAVSNNGCYGGSIGYSGASGTITGAPQFSNPGSGLAYNFTPANGSPLVGAADPARASTVDISGKTRDVSPDIGAYEQ